MYIHELNPIAFSLFDFKIYWYSLSYLFGFIFSYFYVKFILNKDFVNISFKIFEDFLGWAVIGVVIGGRIGYVIFYNLDFYLDNPIETNGINLVPKLPIETKVNYALSNSFGFGGTNTALLFKSF